jgi:hypothetical protein
MVDGGEGLLQVDLALLHLDEKHADHLPRDQVLDGVSDAFLVVPQHHRQVSVLDPVAQLLDLRGRERRQAFVFPRVVRKRNHHPLQRLHDWAGKEIKEKKKNLIRKSHYEIEAQKKKYLEIRAEGFLADHRQGALVTPHGAVNLTDRLHEPLGHEILRGPVELIPQRGKIVNLERRTERAKKKKKK